MEQLTFILVGPPNVGKTALCNAITGSRFKTANFAGVTVAKHAASFEYLNTDITIVDIPGFTSLHNPLSHDEEVAVSTLKHDEYDAILFFSSKNDEHEKKLLFEIKSLGKKVIVISSIHSLNTDADVIFDIKVKFSLENIVRHAKGVKLFPFDYKARNDLEKRVKISEKIDSILLHRFIGIPALLIIIFTMFFCAFNIGNLIGDCIADGFDFLRHSIPSQHFIGMMLSGVLAGIGTVLSFIPSIIIVFIFITLFEQTGYISRICKLLDSVFMKFGLSGRALIPLLSGAGCTVPAYMSTRIIPNKYERFIVQTVLSFIPCSAKNVIFILFCGALFGKYASIVLFGIYIFGILLALMVAKVMSFFHKSTHTKSIEVYPYVIPNFREICKAVLLKIVGYIKNSAVMISSLSAVFTFASMVNTKLEYSPIDSSIIADITNVLMPIFAPLGFSWQMTSALLAGLIAKEVIISTLAVLYAVNDVNLSGIIAESIPFASALSFLCFTFFYMPCISATATLYKETKSIKKVFTIFSITTIMAYTSSILAFKIASSL